MLHHNNQRFTLKWLLDLPYKNDPYFILFPRIGENRSKWRGALFFNIWGFIDNWDLKEAEAVKSYEKWALAKELPRLLSTANYSLYIYSL